LFSWRNFDFLSGRKDRGFPGLKGGAMSIQGCAYSASAASEIIQKCDDLLVEYAGDEKAVEALGKIRKEAESIKAASDSGWY
jgi:hypothetical protein